MHTHPSTCSRPDTCRRAEHVVRDFLGLALQERYLGLETEDLIMAVESIWNNYEPGARLPSFAECTPAAESPVFRALVEELHRARAGRYASERFFVFALDYEYEKEDLLFACDLMWPEGAHIHPVLVRIPRDQLAPPGRN